MSKLWAVHLKPKEDELLSSWLVRLAMVHGLKVHTLCSLTFPGKAIWNRDIDKSASSDILKIISDKTGVSFLQAYNTTLAGFEGYLFEKLNQFGPSSAIMSVGVYHRKRMQFGQQYCPHCLMEDEEPYFRRKWRLTFMTFCEKHYKLLHDRCPKCGSAINFHRGDLGDFHKSFAKSMINCYVCDFDLREATSVTEEITISHNEITFINKLLKSLETGFIRINKHEIVYSHLYFIVLLQIMKTGTMKIKCIRKLRKIIEKDLDITLYAEPAKNRSTDLQEQSIINRKSLVTFAEHLLSDWASRFVQLSEECGVWSSVWLKGMDASPWERSRVAPFWFWKVVHANLYKPKYHPTDEEIKAASKYLIQSGVEPNKVNVSRIVGTVYIRRYYRTNNH